MQKWRNVVNCPSYTRCPQYNILYSMNIVLIVYASRSSWQSVRVTWSFGIYACCFVLVTDKLHYLRVFRRAYSNNVWTNFRFALPALIEFNIFLKMPRVFLSAVCIKLSIFILIPNYTEGYLWWIRARKMQQPFITIITKILTKFLNVQLLNISLLIDHWNEKNGR